MLGHDRIAFYSHAIRPALRVRSSDLQMPGVNLPLNQLGFYMLTLLLCAFLHEAGHALAALRERVRLHGFGIFLFGIYPGAYVDLNTADLQSLTPFGQLRIYCAGVWHNAVIAMISVAVFYAMPWILSPVYQTGTGVGVTYLREVCRAHAHTVFIYRQWSCFLLHFSRISAVKRAYSTTVRQTSREVDEPAATSLRFCVT
ncbi:Membrane-bound transcription factor site-2 protease [Fasciolopsis buskii]|uniref:Membrane-bound transcription factor site-2 protease n=1 Tax=Fasciolopsis buskii TaxID=27845 RepID=A0A8E0S2K0_9TREM|nr:Membrane-bound transcription factor site-2 protease [Fasciolopsis buski]